MSCFEGRLKAVLYARASLGPDVVALCKLTGAFAMATNANRRPVVSVLPNSESSSVATSARSPEFDLAKPANQRRFHAERVR
ncbi:protein of unknown function [Caballeronia sp. S22]